MDHQYSTTNHILLQLTTARRLLLLPNSPPPPPPATVTEPYAGSTTDSTFDANVVMVLSVLLCALICSLGLNSIIRCALRCSHLVPAAGQLSSSSSSAAARLANTGIKKKALKTFPTVAFSEELMKLPGMDAECVICLSEFAAGDRVKILPKCNHGFHVRCIDRWLGSHSSCPTCRHCLIDTCRKIVGENVTAAAVAEAPVVVAPADAAVVVVSMPPLDHEDVARNYRGASS